MNGYLAWSSQFQSGVLPSIDLALSIDCISWDEACGGSTGKAVKVAVIDSGIDATHPAIGNVDGYVAVESGPTGLVYTTQPHTDVYGHGTACAGIIRAIAPECELYSVRVLGPALITTGDIFIAGLRWAIENGMHICNLSLGSTKKQYYAALHELADIAFFRRIMLVVAANNLPTPSFPSVYASVFSVAAHQDKEYDRYHYYYNPEPPIEFGAPGVDVRVPWLNHKWITITGNSFAAPHITGIVARIMGKHPYLTPFQLKVILRSLAANATR
ncbi:serine protease [Ktedonosporobacter rubrisoli]|uniref:Serine protease n=1 Tax=Ktedonosporobacter rubrisoli TaxID=2509675 RepID=A0A4P6JRN6_KTERU|nr:S8 family serine peptidase [Ktedonosporobacter rubrisoli]QBD77486.1 serine protease [Ktedonosporobacter rubrisoli]